MIKLFRTKNQRLRTEYLMPRSKKALLSWKEHQEWMRKKKKIYHNQSDLVFSHLDGSPIKSIRNSWKAICKITGYSDLHFHDLRHTFCSNLILSGASLKEVKEMIGHSDIAMTDRYSHLTSEHKLHRQKKLASIMLRMMRVKWGRHRGHRPQIWPCEHLAKKDKKSRLHGSHSKRL